MSPFRLNLLYIILKIPAILIAFTVQGYAKALVADKLGDKTPRFQGRLTLNPAAHIDLIGFIMILLAGFGWTKPLNTNPSAYKRRYKDAISFNCSTFSKFISRIYRYDFTCIYFKIFIIHTTRNYIFYTI
mgnify:CR=1 FL=1